MLVPKTDTKRQPYERAGGTNVLIDSRRGWPQAEVRGLNSSLRLPGSRVIVFEQNAITRGLTLRADLIDHRRHRISQCA